MDVETADAEKAKKETLRLKLNENENVVLDRFFKEHQLSF